MHRHTAAHVGLDLPQPPIWFLRVAHNHSGFEKSVKVLQTICLQSAPMTQRPDIPALIGSRICHDLISPLGAIGNGLELVGLAGFADAPEMALISESVDAAKSRVRFFRVAFGGASADQRMGRAEVVSILGGAARGGRLSYVWDIVPDQPRNEVRIAFLALLCLETALPYGGDIHITNDAGRWTLSAEADRTKVDPQLWEALSSPRHRAQITAATVQFLMVPDVVSDAGRTLTVAIEPRRITLRF